MIVGYLLKIVSLECFIIKDSIHLSTKSYTPLKGDEIKINAMYSEYHGNCYLFRYQFNKKPSLLYVMRVCSRAEQSII